MTLNDIATEPERARTLPGEEIQTLLGQTHAVWEALNAASSALLRAREG